MKKAHDYLWPDSVWHYWTERRFRAHCEGHNYIVYAGGASTGKSYCAAKVALLFWLAAPDKRGVIVASTTLESLNSRIWGYVLKLVKESKVPLPIRYTKSPTPKLLYTPPITDGKVRDPQNIQDTIHGMFAIAAKKGDDDDAIASWIGRHPTDGLLLVLDEATDMPLSLLRALPNLEAKSENFQLMAIGNSLNKFDLHGTLATPLDGWESIDPMVDTKWQTKQKNGICLFFSCYESPAIHETDEEVRKKCSKFLITEEEIAEKEVILGKDSDGFWRFVLGFWRKSSSSDLVIDPGYIDRYRIRESVTWSGTHPLTLLGGLDPSFTSGGDKCILRLAILGVARDGTVVLDYRGDRLKFEIKINARDETPAELQIIDETIRILKENNCPIFNLAVDCSGAGRMLPETLKLRAGTHHTPLKVLTSSQVASRVGEDEHNWISKSSYDLWSSFRPYMEHLQIRGLDEETIFQLTNRLVKVDKRVSLEGKLEYKRRIANILSSMGRSPDEADAAALTLQVAINRFGFVPGQKMNIDNSPYMQKLYAMSLEGKRFEEVTNKRREHFEIGNGFTSGLESLNLKRLFW